MNADYYTYGNGFLMRSDRCKPKKCRQECNKKSCPVVKTGKLCIEVTLAAKIAFISEELCIGCGICVKVACPETWASAWLGWNKWYWEIYCPQDFGWEAETKFGSFQCYYKATVCRSQSKDNPLGVKALRRTPAKPYWVHGNKGKSSSA